MGQISPSDDKRNGPADKRIRIQLILFIFIGGLLLFLLFYSRNQQNQLAETEETISPTKNNGISDVSPDASLLVTALFQTQMALQNATVGTATKTATAIPSPSYYVSPNGDNSGPGTLSHPWKTLSYAVRQLQPGDTLLIRGGIYQEAVKIENSGMEVSPIVISNFNGEEVIIDGKDNTLPSRDNGTPLVSILGDWVVFQNITVRYSGDMGLYTKGRHVTLDNLYIHHNRAQGVFLTGDYDLIQNSRVWYNSTINENNTSKVGNASGVSCGRYPDYCTIRNTLVWQNWGEGITTYEAMHTTIEGNVSYDNQQNLYISDTKYTLVKGNIAYCSTGNVIDAYETQNGILVGDEQGVPIPLGRSGTRFSSSDNVFINNIVVGCNHNLSVGTGQSTNNLYAFNTFVNSAGQVNEQYNIIFFSGKAENSRFEDNIIVQEDNRSLIFNGGSGVLFTHNLWSKIPPSTVAGTGDVIGDPLFSKQGAPYSAEWFGLTRNSPARNKAMSLFEVPFDFCGKLRDEVPDLGAIEFSPTNN